MKPTDEVAYPALARPANENSVTTEPEAAVAAAVPTPAPATAAGAGGESVPHPTPHRRVRPFAWGFAVLAMLVAVLGLVIGRLAAGPVSLSWAIPLLLPLVDERLDDIQITAGQAELDWQDWQAGPTLRLAGISITGPHYSLTADRLSATLTASQLLAGTLIPGRISGRGLHLVMPLPATGAGTTPATDDASPSDLIARLLRPPTNGPLAALDAIDVADADITLVAGTAGPVWQGRIVEARLDRSPAGLAGRAALEFDQGGSRGGATLDLTTAADGKGADARLAFQSVDLSALAPLADPLLPLTAIAVPLSGTLTTTVDATGRIGPADLVAEGGAGALVVTEAFAERYQLPAKAVQRLAVSRLLLHGTADPAAATWRIDQFALIAADDATISLPAPIDRQVPLRRIDAALALTSETLALETLAIDIGGPVISLAGTVAQPFTAASGEVNGRIAGASIATVKAYWPRQLGVDAYDWVNEHLTAGQITDGRLALTLTPVDGKPTVKTLSLTLPVEGAVVDYLPPMPPVRDGSVTVDITLDMLRATIRRATVAGLVLTEGQVLIPDLAADTPSIDINLRAAGPAASVVDILASPPLSLVEQYKIERSHTSGGIDARIRLAFPLLDDLEFEQMRMVIEAMTSNLAITGLPGDLTVGDGNVRFVVTEQGLRAQGPLVVAGIAGSLDWEEDFQPATSLKTDLGFQISKAMAADVGRGLARWVDLDRYLTAGSFAGFIRFTQRDDGDAAITGRLDLTHAALAVPELRWAKAAGKPASLEAEGDLVEGRLDAVQHVAFMAGDADIHGRALFDPGGRLDSIQVERFRLGRTHLAGSLRSVDVDGAGHGWSITVNGSALDAEPFLTDTEPAAPSGDEDTGKARDGPDKHDRPGRADLANLFISADIDTVWLSGTDPAQRVLVTVTRENGIWRLVQVKGETESGAPFSLDVLPGNGFGRLTVRAADAGATLAALGLLPTMRGGTLSGDGRLESDGDGGIRLRGEVRVDSFRLVQAPLLARLLEVMALTGLRDVLTGRGMFFSSARFPFEQVDGVIEINEARAAGPSLGLTASGTIDLTGETLDLRGTVVPFYWANSLIGALPLIGNWLVGGHPGGGLFSATFRATGPLDDPTLAVNPFSIVLPSVIRMLLELIQGWAAPAGNGAQP